MQQASAAAAAEHTGRTCIHDGLVLCWVVQTDLCVLLLTLELQLDVEQQDLGVCGQAGGHTTMSLVGGSSKIAIDKHGHHLQGTGAPDAGTHDAQQQPTST
jgi:hypothetical protein